MKLYYIEYTVGEDVRHEQIYARSFGQAKIRLRQKAKGITSIQQVSAGYLKQQNLNATT